MKRKISSLCLAFVMVLTVLSLPVSAPVSAEVKVTRDNLAGEFAAAKSYGEVYSVINAKWKELGVIKAPPLAVAPCAKCAKPIREGSSHYVRDNIYTCKDCGPLKVMAKCIVCNKDIYELHKFNVSYGFEDSRKMSVKGFISCGDCEKYKPEFPSSPPSDRLVNRNSGVEAGALEWELVEVESGGGVAWELEDAADADAEMVETIAAMSDEGSSNAPANNDEFSATNVQVEGIEEGDIVKTDGKYIYVASEKNAAVYVVEADNGKMKLLGTYKKENAKPIELLLYNGKLTIIWEKVEYKQTHMHTKVCNDVNCYDEYTKEYSMGYQGYERDHRYLNLPFYDVWLRHDSGRHWDGWGWDNPGSLRADDRRKRNWDYSFETIVDVYEVEKFETRRASYSQKGFYLSSRMVGSNIYLTTTYTPNLSEFFEPRDTAKYIPSYTINGASKPVSAGDIIIPKSVSAVRYTIAGGLDVNSPNLFVSNQLVLGNADTIYTSRENIYVAGVTNTNSSNSAFTDIAKFNYSRGRVRFHSAGRVHGSVLNQMNMDEHKGYLRVATQIEDYRQNPALETNLTILSSNMNTVSRITGIGETEKMRSSRFMGDTAYIVTFMLTDPLYSFDLSDPRNPKIMDELKIPGYSSYMHSWDKESLLGVGFDANDRTGWVTGVKASMFDVKDNYNLSERHVYNIDLSESGSILSPIKDDHRAVIVSQSRNLIAFPYSYNDNDRDKGFTDKLVLFSYDNKAGFKLIGEIESKGQWGTTGFERGVYIGDYIYAVGQQKIISARISRFEVIDEIKFS
ncbi:MAG: beta-propeller domain-containing protein [Oscillospiraceae bacterium]|nr:beta-propeller domain-containing protein [Oscillospiraceae bacterium]